jgi:predicted NAD/FAD-dependent oxidoreductase
MVQIIFFITQAFAQAPVPAPAPAAPSVDWTGTVQKLIAAIASISANPTMALLGVGGVALIVGIGYFFFRSKILAWLQQAATDASNQEQQNIIQQQQQQNQADTNIDNQNQQNLNNTP